MSGMQEAYGKENPDGSIIRVDVVLDLPVAQARETVRKAIQALDPLMFSEQVLSGIAALNARADMVLGTDEEGLLPDDLPDPDGANVLPLPPLSTFRKEIEPEDQAYEVHREEWPSTEGWT